jgi:two-component system chemotaxis sensor kinase CheA
MPGGGDPVNLEKYRALFVEEATDHLAEMGRQLVTLEKVAGTLDAVEPIDTLFRMAHSVKGMAAALSYDAVSDLAHRLEDWMEPLRGQQAVPEGAVPLLLEVVRALEAMVGEVADTENPPDSRPDLLAMLEVPGRLPKGDRKGDRRKKGPDPRRPPFPAP